jgi:nucleotide-binding universal stress UspA family protein
MGLSSMVRPSLKDLLVYVDHDPTCEARVDLALGLAGQHDAHLTGLHAMTGTHLPGWAEAELSPTLRDLRRRQLAERAGQAKEAFEARARRHGVRVEWRVSEGDLTDTVRLHARYADLTVVGQGLDLEGAPGSLAALPEDLVLGVGRPVLVIPRYGTFPAFGQRVLIAWNGSREATRAVNDALPLLARAARVTVLSIDPDDDHRRPRVPSADIALHLARHGIAAEAASTRGLDLGVGDLLLSRAADLGADLIVMGAYGHSRLREMVLGGATRHVLRHMTVPVLMSH